VRFDLVAVGEVLVDVLLGEIAPGELRHGPVRLRAGGTAVNAALAVAGTGARAAVVGRVGDDPAAELIRARLAAAGVEPLLAVDPALPTGTFAEGTVEGARTAVADRGATDAFAAGDLPRVEAVAVLVSGYLLFHDRTREAARAALGAFGARLAAATGGSPSLAARAELAGVDVLVVNAAEARARTGLAADEAALALARDVEIACVTLGAGGAVAARGGQVERVAGGLDRADTLGAGDAFAALLLTALAAGEELGDALRRAGS
jgi:sugar/nucleoside kinase (ribokinase family)